MICTPKGAFAKALDYATSYNSKYGAAGSCTAYALGKRISKISHYVFTDMAGNILNSAKPTVKIGPFYPSYKAIATLEQGAKIAGKSSAYATIGVDLIDCLYYGELKTSYVVDGIILGIGVACPVGWVAGVGYVGLDLLHQHYCNGMSIGDRINNSIGTIKWR